MRELPKTLRETITRFQKNSDIGEYSQISVNAPNIGQ
jgi:hypothetical protein